MNSSTNPHQPDLEQLAAELGVDPQKLQTAARLDPTGTLAAPDELCDVLAVPGGVYDHVVNLFTGTPPPPEPAEGTQLARVLAVLRASGDVRFSQLPAGNRQTPQEGSAAANHPTATPASLAATALAVGDAESKRARFADGMYCDVSAVRGVADLLFDTGVGGGYREGRETETLLDGVRVISLALQSVERTVDAATTASWDPDAQ